MLLQGPVAPSEPHAHAAMPLCLARTRWICPAVLLYLSSPTECAQPTFCCSTALASHGLCTAAAWYAHISRLDCMLPDCGSCSSASLACNLPFSGQQHCSCSRDACIPGPRQRPRVCMVQHAARTSQSRTLQYWSANMTGAPYGNQADRTPHERLDVTVSETPAWVPAVLCKLWI